MTDIYASDLREDLQNDSFMGKGFEDALKKAQDKGDDLVVGEFKDDWKEN
jgi:hypothetical protein